MKKTYKIEPSRSPFGEHKVENLGTIKEILMSCGGGMGGAQWNEYGEIAGNLNENKFVVLTKAITGQTKDLNTANIVTVKDKQLIKVTTDLTPHYNYGGRKTCNSAVETIYYVVDTSDTVVASNDRNTLAGNKELSNCVIYSEIIKK